LQRRAERAGVPATLTDLSAAATADGPGPDRPGPDRPGPDRPVADGAEPDGDGRDEVSEIGAALFALVARAREAGVDPELELRAAARAYRERVRRWAGEQGRDPA
jgi:XTP/dITP diphosphohydrolase